MSDRISSNPRYLVTSLVGDARELYEVFYCQRGDMEDRIKDLQIGLFADRTSCYDFVAIQYRVLLAAVAYVLVEHIRRTALAGIELDNAQTITFRNRLSRIGALVQTNVGRFVVRNSSGYLWKDLILHVVKRMLTPRPTPILNSS